MNSLFCACQNSTITDSNELDVNVDHRSDTQNSQIRSTYKSKQLEVVTKRKCGDTTFQPIYLDGADSSYFAQLTLKPTLSQLEKFNNQYKAELMISLAKKLQMLPDTDLDANAALLLEGSKTLSILAQRNILRAAFPDASQLESNSGIRLLGILANHVNANITLRADTDFIDKFDDHAIFAMRSLERNRDVGKISKEKSDSMKKEIKHLMAKFTGRTDWILS